MSSRIESRLTGALAGLESQGLLRSLQTPPEGPDILNLADNNYLGLAHHPALSEAARTEAEKSGTSASASPLVTGYRDCHRTLETMLCHWYGFPYGLIWNSGYAANHAVLSVLPQRGDLVLADRFIHHSMIAGILNSGARLIRYDHLDLDHLRTFLEKYDDGKRVIFVVTETVFSMDGDMPDLGGMAALKARHPFFWIVDEAHATGWYGHSGSGLVEDAGVVEQVDVLVGTLGKALASQGAYTLFHSHSVRSWLVNRAGEFIYSTYLSPIATAVAAKAVQLCRDRARSIQSRQKMSTYWRDALGTKDWDIPAGNSPIIPILLGDAEKVTSAKRFLQEQKVLVGGIRPPTVPRESGRLRISLKSGLKNKDLERLIETLDVWRRQ